MKNLVRMLGLVAVLFVGPTTASALTTSVDTTTQTVRVDFTGLPPYEQIRLEGVDGLFWCACLDLDNPSSFASTGFTVNGANLEMQYEGAALRARTSSRTTISTDWSLPASNRSIGSSSRKWVGAKRGWPGIGPFSRLYPNPLPPS
jgi:hypothetical protein